MGIGMERVLRRELRIIIMRAKELTWFQHVQDLEEDRLALMKDIIWAYANAVSQVCVEDDSVSHRARSSCWD